MRFDWVLLNWATAPVPLHLWTIPCLTWWRHQMKTFSALLALCAQNSLIIGEFPSKRPVTRSFDVSFDMCLNNGWANNREDGDLRLNLAHDDVSVMQWTSITGDVALFNNGKRSNTLTSGEDNRRFLNGLFEYIFLYRNVYVYLNFAKVYFKWFS